MNISSKAFADDDVELAIASGDAIRNVEEAVKSSSGWRLAGTVLSKAGPVKDLWDAEIKLNAGQDPSVSYSGLAAKASAAYALSKGSSPVIERACRSRGGIGIAVCVSTGIGLAYTSWQAAEAAQKQGKTNGQSK